MYRTWSRSRGHCPGLHIPLVCQARYIASPSTFDKGGWGVVPCFIMAHTERDAILFPLATLSLYAPTRSGLNHRLLVTLVLLSATLGAATWGRGVLLNAFVNAVFGVATLGRDALSSGLLGDPCTTPPRRNDATVRAIASLGTADMGSRNTSFGSQPPSKR